MPAIDVEAARNYLQSLIKELISLPAETHWVEFKTNNSDPQDIGAYISALSNAAALAGKTNAYVVWGVSDDTHDVVGTTFRPSLKKKGNEDLENWLQRVLDPQVHFRFFETTYDGKSVVVLEIPRAAHRPVQFNGVEYVRVGSCRQKLKDHPQIERELWRIFDATPFEDLRAAERVTETDVLSLLDYTGYFDLLRISPPTSQQAVLSRLAGDRLIESDQAGRWRITNLGAVLFAKNIDDFRTLSRKAVRVVIYKGNDRLDTVHEHVVRKGYAVGFEGLIEYLNAILPRNEVIEKALRRDEPMYPEQAIRELVANALIHQDFSVTGAGPMIEVFRDRVEITNPGRPLMSTDRFLDTPPQSRNEALASLMRRIGICEERGSGVDKVVYQTERFRLPAPSFETCDNATRAVLFAYKPLREMNRADRVRACYLHACLRYVARDAMTNSSLRERFGIEEHNSSTASRIIRETLEDGLIKPYDPSQGRKYARYLPWWA